MAAVKTLFKDAVEKKVSGIDMECTYLSGDSGMELVIGCDVEGAPKDLLNDLGE